MYRYIDTYNYIEVDIIYSQRKDCRRFGCQRSRRAIISIQTLCCSCCMQLLLYGAAAVCSCCCCCMRLLLLYAAAAAAMRRCFCL